MTMAMRGGATVVRETVVVDADPAAVWTYVTDPGRFVEWIAGYEPVDGEPAGLGEGATVAWRLRVGPLSVPVSETVTVWRAIDEVRFAGQLSGVSFTSAMQVDETRKGQTRLRVTVAPTLPGWVPGRVARWWLVRSVRRSVRRAAARLEAGGAALDRVTGVYRFWGRHPGWYAASDRLTFLGRHDTIRRRAVEALQLRPGDRVLEVGCGTGRNLGYLVDAVGPTGEVVGLDYSGEMLAAAARLAHSRGWRNVQLVQADAAELPVAGPFAGVLAVLALSAIPDHRRALRRCREVLNVGGRLSVCDARLFTGPLAVLNPLLRAGYGRWAAWDPDRDLIGDLRRLFGTVGVRRYNLGTMFVAAATRKDRHG